ncbi:hypothetical protein AUP68_02211 [Ilyonectria robusta]
MAIPYIRWPNTNAAQLTEWSFIAVTAVLIAARIYLRLKINRKQFAPSDMLICLAWCCSVTMASFDIVFAKIDILRPDVDYALKGFSGPPEKKQKGLKVMSCCTPYE